jgi:cysteine synthase B
MAVVASVLDLIGSTPLIDVSELSPNPNVRILGKAEFLNPAGSVKDRIARQMILEAEEDGTLRPGSVIIEPSSGNTGIALAMICRVRGYHLKVVLPEQTEASGGVAGLAPGTTRRGRKVPTAVRRFGASDQHPVGVGTSIRQRGKPRAHYETTGPRSQPIVEITHFVAGLGTSGTLLGVGTT